MSHQKLIVSAFLVVCAMSSFSKEASAQRYGFFAPELRAVPLMQRPNRPGHFIGNAIRNRRVTQPVNPVQTPSYFNSNRRSPTYVPQPRGVYQSMISTPGRSAAVSTPERNVVTIRSSQPEIQNSSSISASTPRQVDTSQSQQLGSSVLIAPKATPSPADAGSQQVAF